MVRRRHSGTTTTDTPPPSQCPRLSRKQQENLNRRLRLSVNKRALKKGWIDPTKGIQSRRLKQFNICGEECYGCPNRNRPMYPICDRSCKPRCAGVAAAMGYAGRLGAKSVRHNLREAERVCTSLRRDHHHHARKKKKSAKSKK